VVSGPVVLRNRLLVSFCWVAGVCSILGFAAVALTSPVPPGTNPVGGYIAVGAMGLVSGGSFLRAARMRIELADPGITVFHVFTTDDIRWADVAHVSVDYYGLRIERSDGSIVLAGSLGKSNWSKWFNLETAADDWLDAVERGVRAHCT